jgi:hypothetical protein
MATTDTPFVGAALTSPTAVSQFRSEFDTFLYASVEEHGDGPMLSVLSALARLDVDPWQEAAKLSQMSRDKAAWRLAALIEALPGNPPTDIHCKVVATRLIALLPRQIAIGIKVPEKIPFAGSSANSRFGVALIILSAIFTAFLFGGGHLTEVHSPATQSAYLHSSAINKLNSAVRAPNVNK